FSDAGKRFDLCCGARERAELRNSLRSRVQVPAAGVVAQTAPELQHLVLRSRGQRLHGREATQEALVVRNDGAHLSLLEHHLGEPDAVGVARALPREAPTAVL